MIDLAHGRRDRRTVRGKKTIGARAMPRHLADPFVRKSLEIDARPVHQIFYLSARTRALKENCDGPTVLVGENPVWHAALPISFRIIAQSG